MSFDFSNIAVNKRNGNETYTLPLQTPIGIINITGRIAGEANAPYQNEILRMLGTAKKQSQRSGDLTVAQIQQSREQAVALFPQYVFTGWSYTDAEGNEHDGPPDANGDYVPYSPEACLSFLNSLNHDDVDFIRGEFSNVGNFRPAERTIDAEAVGKNLPTS